MRRDIVGFYDFEVFMCDWLVVIITTQDEEIIIHNNPELLKKTMNNINCLIGFNTCRNSIKEYDTRRSI